VQPSDVAAFLAAGNTPKCYERTMPQTLGRFQYYGWYLALTTIALGITLSLSVCLTCVFAYNSNFRRRDKPNGTELCMMLFCPCFAEHYDRKFGLAPSSEEDGEAQEDESMSRTSNSRAVKLDRAAAQITVPPPMASPVGPYYVQFTAQPPAMLTPAHPPVGGFNGYGVAPMRAAN